MSEFGIRKLAPNGRDVKELDRRELEDLIIELDQELTRRTLKITELKTKLTKASALTKRSEETAVRANLELVHPPSALNPDYAKNYAGREALEYLEKSGPKPNVKKAQIVGSYNPTAGANKRIAALREQVAETYEKIDKTKEEKAKLQKKLIELKAKLESLSIPSDEPYKRKFPNPVTKGKKKKVTFAQVRKLLSDLISNEKDQFRKLCYECCRLLVSNDSNYDNDREALAIFSEIYPNEDDKTLEQLKDILSDRTAHVAILEQEFQCLDSRVSALKDAFISLNEKMNGHVVDTDDDLQVLKDRIAELERMIDDIPKTEERIKALKEERDKLFDEKDELFQHGTEEAAKLEAEINAMKAKILTDRAGYDQERIQLEEQDARLRTEYETISAEVRNLRETRIAIADELKRITNEKYKIHDKLQQLANVGITEPGQTYKIYVFANKAADGNKFVGAVTNIPQNSPEAEIMNNHPYMPLNLKNRRNMLDLEFKSKKDRYLQYKAECTKLQVYLEGKSLQEKQYRERLIRAGGKPQQVSDDE